MENEDKIEENPAEGKVHPVQSSEAGISQGEIIAQGKEKISPVQFLSEKNCKCKDKCCALWSKNKKIIIAIIALIAIAVIVAGGFVLKNYWKKIDIGQEAIKTKTTDFLKGKVPEGVSISSVSKENGVYKVMLKADAKLGGQEQPIYVSADGNKIFQGAIDMNQQAPSPTDENQAESAQKTEAEQKNAIPTVDLFVMSYCPYGLQMERGVLPAVEALGNKIKFNLKFVDYTLHGAKEVVENVNQYCIEKTQPAKLNAYLKCFWKSSTGTSESCMKTAGVNASQVSTCIATTNKQFSPTEKAMGLNKEEAVKFGVQGSPTLVVNGTTISSGRDSASVLKAICSGFTTAPKECQATLSATSPVAGFDDQAAASGSSAGAAADCAVPQQ